MKRVEAAKLEVKWGWEGMPHGVIIRKLVHETIEYSGY